VDAKLINAESGTLLWAERFDRDTGDFLELQDEMTSRIAVALTRLSQLDPDLGNFADGLNGNWLIGLVRSRKNSGKAAAVPTK
jgi:hypothetical protein